jgi:hypothetical protein
MKLVRPWSSALIALVLLTACGTVPPALVHEPPMSPAGTTTLPSAVFLPPIGPPIDRSDLYRGADVSYAVHEVKPNGDVNEATLLTLVAEERERDYEAIWRVSDTAATFTSVTRVRVFALASSLGGSALDRECRGQRACVVGSFDAMIRAPRIGRMPSDVLDLTTTQSLPIRVFLQASGATDAPPTSLGDLRRLSDGIPFSDPRFDGLGNCIVNGFTMPGQGVNALGAGVNALGAVGGLLLLDVQELPGGLRLLDPSEAGSWAAGLTTAATHWSGAVLVVDDFGPSGDAFELAPGLVPSFVDPADALAFLTDLVGGGKLSHGALVLHQTIAMVEGAGFVQVAAPSPDFRIFTRGDAGWPYLVVAAVAIGGFDLATANVAQRIQRALGALQLLSDLDDDDFAVSDVAINMSFVIVPCSVLEDYTTAAERIADLATFEDYVAALGADNAVATRFYEELKGLVLAPLNVADDPLGRALDLCDGVTRAERTPIVPATYAAGSAKLDGIAGNGMYALPYGEHTVAITVYDGPRGQMLDWSSSHPVGTVYVKGGPDGTAYSYPGGGRVDAGLHAPLGPSREYHDVSHVVVDFTDSRPLSFLEGGDWSAATWAGLIRDGHDASWDCARGRINYVASSGNFGLDYPLYPAAWAIVAAVGSQDAVMPSGFGTLRSGFANSGQVIAPGALYELSRTAGGDRAVAFAGTSFSAPAVSLFTALDLMREGPVCGTPTFSKLTEEPDAANTELAHAGCVAP